MLNKNAEKIINSLHDIRELQYVGFNSYGIPFQIEILQGYKEIKASQLYCTDVEKCNVEGSEYTLFRNEDKKIKMIIRQLVCTPDVFMPLWNNDNPDVEKFVVMLLETGELDLLDSITEDFESVPIENCDYSALEPCAADPESKKNADAYIARMREKRILLDS